MIRKNIYLTEKQVNFIEQFIKNEGGGTETDVVRQALDSFIEQKESKYGMLIGRLGSFLTNDIYLEISGRATGKTYRLVQHAIQYLEQDSKNKVNIITPTDRSGRNIKQLIGEYYKNRVFVNSYISGQDIQIKNYYDEFDYNDKLKEVDKFGYYCSTASRIRKLVDFEELKKNDFLIKLLLANNGKYVTYCAGDRLDYKLLAEAADSLEFNNNWLKIK